MSDLKKFLAVWLSIIIAGTIFSIGTLRMLSNQLQGNQQNITSADGDNHFSVRWMGFSPTDYNNSYPEYAICINDLRDNPLGMHIAFQIKNQEAQGYYFLIDGYSAPAGWTFDPYQIGYINVDDTTAFVYEDVTRILPSAIPQGRLTETITLVVKAFYDDFYTSLYSEDNIDVIFNFLDRTSASWAILYHDDFDDVTPNNWQCTGEGYAQQYCGYGWSVDASPDYYRSFQYSLRLDASATGYEYWSWDVYPTQGHWIYYSAWARAALRKTFDVGDVAEAYLLFSIKSQNFEAFNQYGIKINGTTFFRSDIAPQANQWYQFAVPLERNCASVVDIWLQNVEKTGSGTAHAYAYLDDVYLITR